MIEEQNEIAREWDEEEICKHGNYKKECPQCNDKEDLDLTEPH